MKRFLLAAFFALLLLPFAVLAEESGQEQSDMVSPVLMGDINGDGIVSAADAALVLRASTGDVRLDNSISYEADINADLRVNKTDALVLLLYADGLLEDIAPMAGELLNGELLGDRYADRFSYHGIVRSGYSYRSANVSVSVEKRRIGKTECFIADIYLRDITCFRTAFGRDQFNAGTQRTEQMALDHDAVIAVNGDSQSRRRSFGPVVRNGIFYVEEPAKNDDVCVLYRDGRMVTYAAGILAEEIISSGDVFQAWDFGPMLLDDLGKARDFTATHNPIATANPRTAIGYFEPGHYLFLVSDGRQKDSAGFTLQELADVLETLGCTAAYNLDGGASSVMVGMGNVINKPFSATRSTTDILYIGEPDSSMIMKEKQGE